MIKKKWIAGGLAVLVVAGAAPWAVGYMTEQQWQEAAREVNLGQPFLQLETDEYRRGLFGAEAALTVTVKNPETAETHVVNMDVQVSHGITGSLMSFRPSGGWQPEGADWFSEGEPDLTLETRLWGSAILELVAPAMRIENPEHGEVISSSGGLLRLDFGRYGKAADLLVVVPEVAIASPVLEARIVDVQVEQSMTWLTGDIWTGGGVATISEVRLQDVDTPPVSVAGLSLQGDTQARDDDSRLDSQATLEVESVDVGEEAIGPHRLEIAFSDLDVESWNRLNTVLTEMQAQAMASTADTDPRVAFEQQMAMVQGLNQAARGIAMNGFSAGIRELKLETPEGSIRGHLDISHPRLSAAEQGQMLMVMQGLTGEVNLSLPVSLAEDYPAIRMQVAPLVKQGLLIQEGDRLVLDGSMEDLMLTINGQDIPLPPLL
ncbi:DUF945 domain-containing protein [Marinobacter fuscus]|uniref:DUF945 domain-containing protein n=1 Tax=Marinobacter fuscus TaxID=2109942 RepID=A0A2T1K571_9GAMM|nr:DUF945 family protein [Marinobacter fuscus]PSF05188.1 DUF945 domain-containing protein [Marinobacter fuscus]